MAVEENGNTTLHYVYTDHLGSINAVTNAAGVLEAKLDFDAWGRRRNPVGYSYLPNNTAQIDNGLNTSSSLPAWLYRGYTGHEMLDEFTLINMNARLYDPVLGLMAGVDNVIQAPNYTQNYSRYNYCFNNPLKYTDPTGNYAVIDDIIAAGIGGVINLAVNAYQGNLSGYGFWGGLGRGAAAFGAGAVGGFGALYPEFGGWIWGGATVGATNAWLRGATSARDIAVGAGVGIVSSVVGGAAGQWAGQGLGGVVINGFNIASPVAKGAITGAIGGAAGGYAGGFAGELIMTGSVNAASKAGLQGLAMGAGIGGAAGSVGGYASAKKAGVNPWTGKANNSITIGENMSGRVGPASRDLGSETLQLPDELQPGYLGKDMIDPRAMDFNAQWIEMKMQTDVYIYDVGPKGSSVQSPFYNMEMGRTMVYPKVYNVHIQQVQTIRVLIIYK